MADSKISALTELSAAPASGDLLVLVDVSDTTMAASGTDKKITFTNLTGTFLTSSTGLLATGATTGATSQAQTFTNGIKSPSVQAISDSTTHGWKNTAGTNVLTVDTTNSRLGIGVTPIYRLTVSYNDGVTSGDHLVVGIGRFGGDLLYGYRADGAAVTGGLIRSAGSTGLFFGTTGAATALTILNAGYVGIGTTAPTALLHVGASTTTRASACVNVGTAPTTPVAGDIWNDGALSFYNADATTNAIVNHLRLSRDSTGTAAAGLGLGILAELGSTTTSRQSAGRLTWEWATATHASRAAKGKLTAYYTSTEREVITWVADSSSARVGIMQASPYTTLDVAGGVRISSFLTPSAGAGLELGYDGGNNRATITAYDRDASAYKTFLQNGLDYQFYISGSEKVRIDTGGNVGIGVSSPQSLIHGHDGSGGFLFVNRASVGGTLVTVIPDAAGDVTEKIFFVGWCTNSAPFSADVAPTTLAVSSSTTKTDGTNTLTIAVTAGGAFTLQATGGAATWNVNLWVFWR